MGLNRKRGQVGRRNEEAVTQCLWLLREGGKPRSILSTDLGTLRFTPGQDLAALGN